MIKHRSELQLDVQSSAPHPSSPAFKMQELQGYTSIDLSLPESSHLEQIHLTMGGLPQIEELFITAPNVDDVQTVSTPSKIHLGLNAAHDDAEYGSQWMFSPPPLVFPYRTKLGWLGIALAAPRALNQFSGCSLKAGAREHELIVHYDRDELPAGQIASVWLLNEVKPNPGEVIKWYSDQLRAKGWAPTPNRIQPTWWREPMLCTWGEQCNQGHAKGCKDPSSIEINMYETQANQLRWLDHVESKGVPVGLVSMSDKWQLNRERLLPDLFKYPDLRGFADEIHERGKHLIAWFGLWRQDQAPNDWCLLSEAGEKLTLDPESPAYSKQLVDDVKQLISPEGFDIDGFFIDFTADGPMRAGIKQSGKRWGLELLHHYVKTIHDAAKSVKPDAMIMTHCCHPIFADVTDVLRLNDFAFKRPNVVEQARYRHTIASNTSDWLINTDNWFMYSIDEWRRYLEVQPEIGIPSSWYAQGVHGDGTDEYVAFTDDDYERWADIWHRYRARIR